MIEIKGPGSRWSLEEQAGDGVERNRLKMEFRETGWRWSLKKMVKVGV